MIFDEHARVNIVRKLNAGTISRRFTLNQLVRKLTTVLWVPPKKLYHKWIHETQKMVPLMLPIHVHRRVSSTLLF